MNKTWFISDLHLSPAHPHLFELFYDFIDDIKDQAEALYILGDLFEFWIGDDIIDLPMGKPYLPVIDKLKSLSDSGTKIYFMQGNRDFLAQDTFVKHIGAELLPDQKVIDLYGTPTLIMHGDTLCIDDKGYQRMRALFRLKVVQKLYLMLSPEKRGKKATDVRKNTQQRTQKKNSMILDVNQQEVERVLADCIRGQSKTNVKKTTKSGGVYFSSLNTAPQKNCLLIHGHTHRPAEHEFEVEGRKIKRIVLGDWRDKACYLVIDQQSCRELIY